MAYKRWPELYPNEDAARDAVRYIRGGGGEKKRSFAKRPPSPYSADLGLWSRLPESDKHFDKTWEPYVVKGPLKALIIGDLHVPYHHRSNLIVALNAGLEFGITHLLLNGDLCDFYALSPWETDPRKRDFKQELNAQRKVLEVTAEAFPKAVKIFKLGNHEERYIRYMTRKAPELLGVDDFQFEKLLRLDKLMFTVIGDKRPIRFGDLNILHGHEYRFAISNPVNAARGLFLRAKAHALCHHFHQKSEHSENTVRTQSVATWSVGCLCDLHPEYGPLNNWVHGFALLDVKEDGKFSVHNKLIAKDGVVY